jgi:hypothetical protein
MKLTITANIDEVHAAQALERFIKNNKYIFGDNKRVELYLSLLKKITAEATKDDLEEYMPRNEKYVLDNAKNNQ